MVKHYLKRICFILCVVIPAALFISGRFIGSGAKDQDGRITLAVKRSFDIEVNTIGSLDAARSHMISSSIRGDQGKIIDLVADGARVKKGDILVKLDSAPFAEKVSGLQGDVETFESAVEAKKQMLEWEKNKVERDIKTAEFNLTIAQLDKEKLVKGDGPHEIAQLSENAENAKENLDKYRLYLNSLNDLKKEGYDYPSEISLARNKIKELDEKYNSARQKLESYRDHIFPLLNQMATAKIEKCEQDLIQTKKCGASEIAQAIAEAEATKSKLATIKGALKQAKADLENTTITAPFPGIAILYKTYRNGENRKPRIGDYVLQNQPILYLPDISAMVVRTQVREVDLYKITLNQRADIRVDAYPGTLLKGTISFIGSLATGLHKPGMGGNYFAVTIMIDGEDIRLRPGMTARASILTDQVKNVLALPRQAVFEHRNGAYCYKYEGGWFKKTVIGTGRHNEDYIEIISGLNEADKISLVKPDPDKIILVDS